MPPASDPKDDPKQIPVADPAAAGGAAEAPDEPGFKAEIKEVEFDGYKFEVNTDLIDDVEVLDMIDAIENQEKPKVIIDFLKYLIGDEGYEKLKAYFVEKDGRFRLSKLSGIYQAIFEGFDPKE